MKTSVPQVFELIDKTDGIQEKATVLQKYDSLPLQDILKLNFDPDYNLLLPEGEPPFKKDTEVPEGYSESNLYVEHRRFYIWKDPNINLGKIRKEQLFIQMLEGVHWKEAEAVCLAKDKKLQAKYKTLSEDVVRLAFPNLLPPPKEAPKRGRKKKEESVAS
jgi:hypothetical protein